MAKDPLCSALDSAQRHQSSASSSRIQDKPSTAMQDSPNAVEGLPPTSRPGAARPPVQNINTNQQADDRSQAIGNGILSSAETIMSSPSQSAGSNKGKQRAVSPHSDVIPNDIPSLNDRLQNENACLQSELSQKNEVRILRSIVAALVFSRTLV